MRVCLASHYSVHPATYNGLLFEAVRAIAEMTGARIIEPKLVPHGRLWSLSSGLKRRATGLPRAAAAPERLSERCDLFLYVCMCTEDLLHLQGIEGWREMSGRAAVFLFESWAAQATEDSPYYRLLDDFDHVFLFNPRSVAAIQGHTRAPCSYLPAAVDVLLATPALREGPRPIDMFGMGRMDQRVHAQLVEMTERHDLYYYWEPWGLRMPEDGYAAARARTYHLIRSSRLFTSFNFATPSAKSAITRGEEAIPARVFEGAAGGAVLLGTPPPLPEFRALFDWPDSFLEIATDPVDMPSVWASLRSQPERLRRAGLLNAARSLRGHDWSHRLEAMLEELDLPVPSRLLERKARLAHLAAGLEAQLGPSLVAVG